MIDLNMYRNISQLTNQQEQIYVTGMQNPNVDAISP